jgi:hypothetical protein
VYIIKLKLFSQSDSPIKICSLTLISQATRALYAAETVYPVEIPIELPTFLKIPKYHLERSSTSEMDDIFNLTSTITATDTALFQLIQSHWETEDEQLTNRLPRGIEMFGKFFSWCCELATHQEIFPSGVTARDTLRDLNSEVASAFQKIAHNNIEVGNYTQSVRQFLVKMTSAITKIVAAVSYQSI